MRAAGIRRDRKRRTSTRRAAALISIAVACFLFGGVSMARAQTAQSFAYKLTTGGAKTLIAGSSTSQTVTATRTAGTSQIVTFSVSGLPTGASLALPSCYATCSSGGVILTSSQTPLGTYSVTIAGSPAATSTTFTLMIVSSTTAATSTATTTATSTPPSTATSTAATSSPSGTLITPGSGSIIDSLGAVWTLATTSAIKRNGLPPTNPDFAPQTLRMLYWNGSVYHENVLHAWRRWDTAGRSLTDPANWVVSSDPRPAASSTPVTATLVSSHPEVAPGQLFVLTWSSTGATSCAGNAFPTGDAPSGTLSVSVSATTTFSVRCGTASATTTIGIKPVAAGAPSIPTGLTARIEGSAVRLSWTASYDDFGVVGYQVYRDGQRIGTTLQGATTFLDTRAALGAAYAYVIAAYDASGQVSPRSAELRVALTLPPVATTTPASGVSTSTAQTIARLQAQIAALLATIQTLEAAVASVGTISTPVSPFIRDLDIGSEGEDVRRLQQFLNRKGFLVATSGAGSPGYETTTFGPRTQAALALWQSSVGIYPALGYFGPKTRAFIATQL
ncbi:peptidoglycan-binding protein [Candidatus Kaiserbacteria bacterium]|nr:peptidoglycan-binding protein [Candidatus Kaiserbacteria bacterium]